MSLCISYRIKLKFDTGIQNSMLILVGSISGLGDDFGQDDTKTIISPCFLTKRLLGIALPLRHLRCQVIKNYLKGWLYVNTKSHKVSASYT